MKHYLQLTKQFLLVITPLLASSMLVTLPSRAATFASSEGKFQFTGFSQTPLRVVTSSDTSTSTIGESGSVIALAQAEAFFTQKFPAQAFNYSWSVARGENNAYLGEAESEASLLGVFNVKANSNFSFNFAGNLDLSTSIDNPSYENARASGEISFALFDTANDDILEFFSLSGNLITKGDGDFITYEKSDNVTLKNNLAPAPSLGERQEFATASVQGFVKRTFASQTNLALIEVKKNKVMVKTPEPSTSLAFLLSCGVVGLVFKRKPQKTVIFVNKV